MTHAADYMGDQTGYKQIIHKIVSKQKIEQESTS